MDNSTPPQTTNEFATIVNRVLSGLIKGAAEDEVIALILASAPGLFAIPVIGWIASSFVKLFVSRFGIYFYQASAQLAAKVIISIQADQENSAALKAAKDLQDALSKGNQDEISKADQALQDAYGNLIHSDGSAPP